MLRRALLVISLVTLFIFVACGSEDDSSTDAEQPSAGASNDAGSTSDGGTSAAGSSTGGNATSGEGGNGGEAGDGGEPSNDGGNEPAAGESDGGDPGASGSANGGAAGVANSGAGGAEPRGGAPNADCDCDEGEFCERESCEEGAPGQCATITEICTQEYDPVCGCDGMTYSNDCTRRGAAVSKAHDGECEGPMDSEQFCGGIAGFQCDDENEFCDLECDIADAGGVCRHVPSACTRERDPVCGCDNETYSNDCERRRAGVGLRREGECR